MSVIKRKPTKRHEQGIIEDVQGFHELCELFGVDNVSRETR